MAIYEGSRYTNVYTYDFERGNKLITGFNIRELTKFDLSEAVQHQWREGDRLDNLAERYYGNPTYWWAILEANTRYMEEHEIQNGDWLNIPPYSELRRVVVDSGE